MCKMETYDRKYFESDDQTRGYRAEGYRDFAAHYATASIILKENPTSFLELGAGRGYVSKIIQSSGIEVLAMDISAHCWHTRAVEMFAAWDITQTPWKRGRKTGLAPLTIGNKEFDLCFSIALLEHIPERDLDNVIREMARVSKRGLHAPSLAQAGDPDPSHTTMHPIEWWQERFASIAPDYPVKIMDKEDMEFHGDMSKIMPFIPKETREAGEGGRPGRVMKKINFGSFVGQFYYGFLNVDIIDMEKFAMSQGYKFMKLDVTKPLPFPDGYADYEFSSHLIEHLSREEGARFIRECFRILRPGGMIRIATPNTGSLMTQYMYDMGKYEEHLADYRDAPDEDPDGLKQYRHVNVGVGDAETPIDAFAHLALSGHKSVYDIGVLYKIFVDAGFENITVESPFHSMSPVVERETIVSHATLSLVVEARKPNAQVRRKRNK